MSTSTSGFILSFVLLFFVYHPYAKPYQIATNPDDILAAAGVTHNMPLVIRSALYHTLDPYHFWLAVTTLLSVIALFLLYRMLPRRRSA
jgi:hypothetical protein